MCVPSTGHKESLHNEGLEILRDTKRVNIKTLQLWNVLDLRHKK